MSKFGRRSDRARTDRATLPLFGASFGAPTWSPLPLKAALAASIKGCPRSREQIADLMSGYLGRRINPTEIDSWTAPSKPDHFPRADELEAFCWATGDGRAASLVASAAGCLVVSRADAELLELARAQIQYDQAADRLTFLKSQRRNA